MRNKHIRIYAIATLALLALGVSTTVHTLARHEFDAVPPHGATPKGPLLTSEKQVGMTTTAGAEKKFEPGEHVGVGVSIPRMQVQHKSEKNFRARLPIPASRQTEIMAWVYPGSPACGARDELSDGRKIYTLKVEYFRVEDGGMLRLLDEARAGCNGFSEKNIAYLKRYSLTQYVTVSTADTSNMDLFLEADDRTGTHVAELVLFVVEHGFTGVEIDFEDFGNWDQKIYERYKAFITRLGSELHRHNKKLMVDGPATGNAEEEAWYSWRYNDFTTLPVDQLVVMAYDYQFDTGAGNPVAPLAWIRDVVRWVVSRYPDKNRLTIGIPSYGYRGTTGTQRFTLLTHHELQREPGFEQATRDSSSGEMTWERNGISYFYQDSRSMALKREVIESLGIRSISVWHLGGNPWFQ